MLDTFNFPTPQNCNFQEFYYQSSAPAGRAARWVKPRGCSMIRILLISGGGGGSANASLGGAGGGSGAMASLIIPAMFVPDNALISIGAGGAGAAQTASSSAGSQGGLTSFSILTTSTSTITLLSVQAGGGGTAAGVGGSGGALTAINNYFTAAGILQAVAGQTGAASNTNLVATSTIPLTGGAGGRPSGNTRSVTPNYGYPEADAGSSTKAANGYFQLSPILLGCGGGGGGSTQAGGDGGIGCGGGGGGSNGTTGYAGGKGGNGAAFIWAW